MYIYYIQKAVCVKKHAVKSSIPIFQISSTKFRDYFLKYLAKFHYSQIQDNLSTGQSVVNISLRAFCTEMQLLFAFNVL